jgi:hypothetical protein
MNNESYFILGRKDKEGIVRFEHLLCYVFLVSIWLASCRSGAPPVERKIETADDLVAALGDAGRAVIETTEAGIPAFGVPARMLQVDQTIVQVYEYVNVEARIAISQTISPYGEAVDETVMVWPDRPKFWATGRLIVIYNGTDGGMILLLSGLLGDPLAWSSTLVDEPYPPAVTAAIQYIAYSLNVEPARVEVLNIEAVDWPDSCLSLPEPVERCVEVITPGWHIFLWVEGQIYQVSTDQFGEDVRLH